MEKVKNLESLIIIKHSPGAPGLRLLGMGPRFFPLKGIVQLKKLFDNNTSWAKKRNAKQIKKMLSKSKVIISVWHSKNLVGFGRATSDEVFRAVLWDIVVSKKYQHIGLGRKIVSLIINNPIISKTERIYIMTTDCEDFYFSMGFKKEDKQSLMIFKSQNVNDKNTYKV